MKFSSPFFFVSASVAALLPSSYAFATTRTTKRSPSAAPRVGKKTALNLEDHIADMIDGEVIRLEGLRRDAESRADSILNQQRRNNDRIMEPTLPAGFDFNDDPNEYEFAKTTTPATSSSVLGFTDGVDRTPDRTSPRRRRDEKMAGDDPMRYCADRCVATGNCDVFEDLFDLEPREVVEFCEGCVLSEGEEPCDVPESVFEVGRGLGP